MVMVFATGIMSAAAFCRPAQAAEPRRKNPVKHSCLVFMRTFRLRSSLRGHEIRLAFFEGVAVAEWELPRRVPLHLDLQVLLHIFVELWSGRFVSAVKPKLPRVTRAEPERHA